MGANGSGRRGAFFLERSREALLELDADGAVTFASPGVRPLLGYDPEALVGRRWADLAPEQYRAALRSALCTETAGFRYFTATAAGAWVHVEEDGTWDPASGRRTFVLRLGPGEGTERLKDLVEHLPELVLYQTQRQPDGQIRFSYVSPGVRDLLGHEAESWERDPTVAYGTVHQDDNDAFMMLSSKTEGTPQLFDLVARHRTAWGETKWLRMCSRQRTARDGLQVWDGFLTDVTEDEVAKGSTAGHLGPAALTLPGPRRRGAETVATRAATDEALLDLRLKLSQAIEQSDEAIIMTAAGGKTLYVNPSCGRLLGGDRIRALARPVTELTDPSGWPGLQADLVATVTRGQVWRGGLTCRRFDGSTFEAEGTVSPVRDAQGNIEHYVGVFHDVSERRAMEQRLRQAQKLEAIGTLAGGIAHDFNNVLMAINGFAALARDQIGDGGTGVKSLGKIELATRRATNLVQQILTFSRGVEGERSPLRLAPVVRETLKLLKATLPATIELREDVDPDLVAVADPTHVHQVVMNLCTNAFHAMRDRGGALTVRLAPAAAPATAAAGLPLGPHLELAVEDTGCGMPDAVKARLFEPFFTTKAPGEGTGLGLSIVHGLARSYGGAVTVDSEVGRGSTLRVFLPRALDLPVPEPAPTPAGSVHGHERVLLVDDEALLVDFEREALEQLGYRVTVASDPREALAGLRRDPTGVDLVVTDQTMPHLTGVELMAEVWRLRPTLPALLCSGFSDKVDETRALALGFRAFMKKPFDHRELARAIRRTLDR